MDSMKDSMSKLAQVIRELATETVDRADFGLAPSASGASGEGCPVRAAEKVAEVAREVLLDITRIVEPQYSFVTVHRSRIVPPTGEIKAAA